MSENSDERNPWKQGLRKLCDHEIDRYISGEDLVVTNSAWGVTDSRFSEDDLNLCVEFDQGELVIVFRSYTHCDQLDVSVWRDRKLVRGHGDFFWPGEGIDEDSEHIMELQLQPGNRDGFGEKRRYMHSDPYSLLIYPTAEEVELFAYLVDRLCYHSGHPLKFSPRFESAVRYAKEQEKLVAAIAKIREQMEAKKMELEADWTELNLDWFDRDDFDPV